MDAESGLITPVDVLSGNPNDAARLEQSVGQEKGAVADGATIEGSR